MNEFTSGFWSFYVAILTLGSIGYCAWLLWKTGRSKLPAGQGTEAQGPGGKAVELTGHTWDGDLAEYNNPLPRWWMWLFWITIVFSLAYLVLYPGLGSHRGVLEWSSTRAWTDERDATEARVKPLYDRYLAMDLKQVAADTQAHAMGERLFLNNCAQCHGSDAAGGKGYPNLRDGDSLYGGEPDTIKASILGGRNGVMPALGPAIGEENVRNVAHFVRSLSGLPHNGLKAQLGKPVFMQNCAACHGAAATGNKAMGAPNLADKVWLYGSSEQTIVETVMKGRGSSTLAEGQSAMPAWKDKLGEGKAHVLAAYVWSLSNMPGGAK